MTRILLIEDDQVLAGGIIYTLENEGWQVTHASTLGKGTCSLQEQEYDLILLDVMLPDGSGFNLCKRIRATNKIPIIFLTACDDEVNVIQGLDLGGDDYLTKPFRVRELISRIRAVLRRRVEPTKEDHLFSGSILLDSNRKLVLKQDEQIFLSPMEFRLLQVFMKNPLQVLSRAQILAKIWDIEGEFIDDNTLSVYIRRLREKIENQPSKPDLIVTVRGVGYKWNKGRGSYAGPNL